VYFAGGNKRLTHGLPQPLKAFTATVNYKSKDSYFFFFFFIIIIIIIIIFFFFFFYLDKLAPLACSHSEF
jgi:hypothetical protein